MGEGLLTLDHALLKQVAAEVGTPVYVYDAAAIRSRYEQLTGAFGDVPHKVFYSVKSNSNLSILVFLLFMLDIILLRFFLLILSMRNSPNP